MVTQMRAARQRNTTRALALVVALAVTGRALADGLDRGSNASGPDAKRRAAAAYDQGLKHFKRASYAEAARAFLEADTILPNPDALTNAIVAGRRANEHLLVATAAERVLSRTGSEERIRQAREALAEASLQLARLDLACAPAPCSLTLDGAAVPDGKRFVQPGVVEIVATSAGAARSERFKLAAGANYVINIKIDEPDVSPVVTPAAAPPPAAAAPKPAAARPPPAVEHQPRKPLPPAVFYGGVAATALAAGFTTWSGLSAVDSYNALPNRASEEQVDDAQAEITRTDILLGVTLVLGAATAVSGVFFVDWQGAGSEQQSVLIGARGRL
jgi:hypothetical protein